MTSLLSPARDTARATAVTALAAALLAAVAAPASAQDSFAAEEAANYARTLQAPTQQAADPDFLQRWQLQSLANSQEFAALGPARALATTGNVCREHAEQCTGDPYRYPASTRSTTTPSSSR